MTRLSKSKNGTVHGQVGDVTDEKAFTDLLVSLAPLDHIVFSGVDKVIRGPLAETDFDNAKALFGVKFWGSFVVGKGEHTNLLFIAKCRGTGLGD